MIYTAPCIMFWMRAYPLLGQVGGVWALEFSSFLGPKWHPPIGSMPYLKAQKTLHFQGPSPSHWYLLSCIYSTPLYYSLARFSFWLWGLPYITLWGRPVCIKTQKNFFIFLLSVEALLEADSNEFWFGTFYVFFSWYFEQFICWAYKGTTMLWT